MANDPDRFKALSNPERFGAAPAAKQPEAPPQPAPTALPRPSKPGLLDDRPGMIESLPENVRIGLAVVMVLCGLAFVLLHHFSPGSDRYGNSISPAAKAVGFMVLDVVFAFLVVRGRGV